MLAVEYAAPLTPCAAAWPHEPLAFDNDSVINVGTAVMSLTTDTWYPGQEKNGESGQ